MEQSLSVVRLTSIKDEMDIHFDETATAIIVKKEDVDNEIASSTILNDDEVDEVPIEEDIEDDSPQNPHLEIDEITSNVDHVYFHYNEKQKLNQTDPESMLKK